MWDLALRSLFVDNTLKRYRGKDLLRDGQSSFGSQEDTQKAPLSKYQEADCKV